MEKTVIRIISEISKVSEENIRKDDMLISLGVDSLEMVELMVQLEEELSINFNEADLELSKLKEVNDIINLVEEYSHN